MIRKKKCLPFVIISALGKSLFYLHEEINIWVWLN